MSVFLLYLYILFLTVSVIISIFIFIINILIVNLINITDNFFINILNLLYRALNWKGIKRNLIMCLISIDFLL